MGGGRDADLGEGGGKQHVLQHVIQTLHEVSISEQ